MKRPNNLLDSAVRQREFSDEFSKVVFSISDAIYIAKYVLAENGYEQDNFADAMAVAELILEERRETNAPKNANPISSLMQQFAGQVGDIDLGAFFPVGTVDTTANSNGEEHFTPMPED